jgi:hypothetical protein
VNAARQDLEDAATHLGLAHELRFKPMFGGLMAYFSERPCAWIDGAGRLALKVAPEEQAALLAIDGVSRFVHSAAGAKPSRDYLVLPSTLTRDTPAFAAWLERCRLAPHTKKPARKRRP